MFVSLRRPSIVLIVVMLASAMCVIPSPADAASDDASCRAVPVNADRLLDSANLRKQYGVDGTGVTIGIISSSFNINTPSDPPNPAAPAVSDQAENVHDGLLPGEGNPCGYTDDVVVLRELWAQPGESYPVSNDEGRAMAQVIHGIAPGADLVFYTAGYVEQDMITAVNALTAYGVDMIVDDVAMNEETWFQASDLSGTVNAAVTDGTTYFSSSSNATVTIDTPGGAGQTPVNGWRTDAYRPATCATDVAADLAGLFPGTTTDCLDFDAGTGIDTIATMGVLPATLEAVGSSGSQVTLPLQMQWAQNESDANQSFGIIVSTNSGAPTAWIADPGSTSIQADVTFDVPTDPTDAVDMEFAIFRFTSGPAATTLTPAIGWVANTDSAQWAASAEYWQSNDSDTVGSAIYGHHGAQNVITAGGIEADSGDFYYFGGIGPTVYYPEPESSASSASELTTPQVFTKPTLLGVTGELQTALVDGAPVDGAYTFYGTSAAGPSLAAVAALALELDPGLTPAQIESYMTETALAFPSPYADVTTANAAGAGFIDTAPFLAAVSADLPTPAPSPSASILPATGAASDPGPVAAVAGWMLAGGVVIALAVGVVRRRSRRS